MTDPTDRPPVQATKADPATLVLRGAPRRVVRFRRSVILGGVGLASMAMFGATWLGLRPTVRSAPEDVPAAEAEAAQRPPDALAGAPKTYGDVPRLGPPLPGDLGRPILKQQRALAPAGQPTTGADPAGASQPVDDERARRDADAQAARRSAVMIPRSQDSAAPPSAAGAPAADAPSVASAGTAVALDPARDPGAQQRKIDFVGAAPGDRNPFTIAEPPSPYLLSAGSMLSASLITGLDSDLPGLVTAQITENAYDSPTARILLVPQGARLIGSYDSVVAFGQKRALVVWQRILFPDGSSVRIENWPASDAGGYAGLSDRVDLHGWQLLKGVALRCLGSAPNWASSPKATWSRRFASRASRTRPAPAISSSRRI